MLHRDRESKSDEGYAPLKTNDSMSAMSTSSTSSSTLDIESSSARTAPVSSSSASRCKRSLIILWSKRYHILVSLLISIIIFITWMLFANTYESIFVYDHIFGYPTYDVWGRKIYRIGFEGDSLCPSQEDVKKMITYLKTKLPTVVWSSVDDCIGGSIVNKDFPDCPKCRDWARYRSDIVKRMDNGLLNKNIDCIFLLWDSDAADVNEGSFEGISRFFLYTY